MSFGVRARTSRRATTRVACGHSVLILTLTYGENIEEGDHKSRPYHGRRKLCSGKENRFSHYFTVHQIIEGVGGAFEGVGGGDMGFEFALGKPGQ